MKQQDVTKPMSKHIFGGPWTEIKLDAVEYYLECYTRALKRVGFDLWYIDAFAGSGDREREREVDVSAIASPQAQVESHRARLTISKCSLFVLFLLSK